MPQDTKRYVTNPDDIRIAGEKLSSGFLWVDAPGGDEFWTNIRGALRAMSGGSGARAQLRVREAIVAGLKDPWLNIKDPRPQAEPTSPGSTTDAHVYSITEDEIDRIKLVITRYRRLIEGLQEEAGSGPSAIADVAMGALRDLEANIPALNRG